MFCFISFLRSVEIGRGTKSDTFASMPGKCADVYCYLMIIWSFLEIFEYIIKYHQMGYHQYSQQAILDDIFEYQNGRLIIQVVPFWGKFPSLESSPNGAAAWSVWVFDIESIYNPLRWLISSHYKCQNSELHSWLWVQLNPVVWIATLDKSTCPILGYQSIVLRQSHSQTWWHTVFVDFHRCFGVSIHYTPYPLVLFFYCVVQWLTAFPQRHPCHFPWLTCTCLSRLKMEKTQSASISQEFAQSEQEKLQEHQIREAWLTFFLLVQRCAKYNWYLVPFQPAQVAQDYWKDDQPKIWLCNLTSDVFRCSSEKEL